jgi:putative NADH-flavin reductase
MRLFLLGATGNGGRRILKYALERDHQVTAFVRDQSKLPDMLGPWAGRPALAVWWCGGA